MRIRLEEKNAPSAGLLLVILAIHGACFGQDAAEFFRQNCTSCHTIGGGRLTGPDLKGVFARQQREWLARFITNPQAILDADDAYALKLQRESPGNTIMPGVPEMGRQRAESLLDLIEEESKRPRSQFAGVGFSSAPVSADDVRHGRAYFLGVKRLANGGPACISCHTLAVLGALGGGRFGPDLTLVVERLKDRKAAMAWLAAPPQPPMRSVFGAQPLEEQEIFALAALLQSSAQQGQEADMSGPLSFLLLGLGGATAGLAALGAFWKKRVHTVSRARSRHHFRSLVPLRWAIIVVLLGHLLVLSAPRIVLAWNSRPLRLYILEVIAIGFGILTLVGVLSLITSRPKNGGARPVASVLDGVFCLLLLAEVATGVYIAVFHPWGSSWLAAVAAPDLWSILLLSPNTVALTQVPCAVPLHIINAFVLIGLFPFSRLGRRLLIPGTSKRTTTVIAHDS